MDEKSRNAGMETTDTEDSPQKPQRSKCTCVVNEVGKLIATFF